MQVMLLGMLIEVREEHLPKAPFLMIVTLLGISIEVREEQEEKV